ncbi:MAG: valine--tRNA ligase [Burkholderiaceae bacterium]
MTVDATPKEQALAKSFEPQAIEAGLYAQWAAMGCFDAGKDPHAKPFCIQLPPPNVTGTLHMGHAFNQTIMDALTRWQRMKGANALWLPGTDHAGIATQMVVERQLEAKGQTRHDLGRQAFIEKVWEWKQISGSTITQQMRRLGASADWNLEYFTMDEKLSAVVREAFIKLYQQGLIYRGKRLINWDPVLMTAVSDLEVVSEEEQGSIWEIHYPLLDDSGHLTVATTRPETMLGDTAIMVHPDDLRYQHLIGKQVRLPLTDRVLPIIADSYVDPSFGTGVVKVTPAHDFNDYAVGQRHKLPTICILNLDASISDDAPEAYRGLDRFEARKRIVQDLENIGALGSVKPHRLMIPRGDRSGAVIEPMLTDQWFVAMSKPAPQGSLFPGKSIAQVSLEVVEQGKVRFVPSNWTNTYNHWLENIQDWTISRQLWWGHQIPAWYRADEQGAALHDAKVYVARDEADARRQANADGWTGGLVRDPDVLDTWFSSALVPFSTLADESDPWPQQSSETYGLGLKLNPELAQFLPSQVLVTGFDIIFFWVARMVMMSTHFTGKVPFETVYVHALVRDAEGQKMSKSKGNTLDPIDLIDGIELEDLVAKRTSGLMNPKQAESIAKKTRKEYPQGIPGFGADALRFTFASLATPGRNINFDLNRCEGYRNFCNKLWNATRFVLMQVGQESVYELGFAPHDASACVPGAYMHFGKPERWMSSVLEQSIAQIEQHLCEFRFDLAAKEYYELVWQSYCDWYLELAKVQLQHEDAAVRRGTRRTLLSVLETILRLGHPFMPFMTETLWQSIAPLAQRYHAHHHAKAVDTPMDSGSAPSTPAANAMPCSIMQQAFPMARPERVDPEAIAWMSRFKALVDACRQLRSEMSLSPAQRVPLLIEGAQAAAILDDARALQSLARLQEVQVVEQLPSDRLAPVQWLDGLRLMLDVEIDRSAELLRLSKEIERIDLEIAKCRTKLANPSFADRAPKAVVEQEHERMLRFEKSRAALSDQYERINIKS